MSTHSKDELGFLDTFVPPSERKKPTTPSRKRPAVTGIGMDLDGSPSIKRTSVKREKSESKTKAAKASPKIIFGLDYGTTFSGLAYACLDKLDHISVLMDLDDSNQDDPKVPSALKLTGSRLSWGNNAKGVLDSIEWVKLLLVDEDDLPEEVRASEHVLKARERLKELDRTPEDLIGLYLHSLWTYCLRKLKTEVSEETVDNSRFHVVVTLPAIWPSYARQRMEAAVEAAGILNRRDGVADTVLTFVSEPEAAALATLKRVDGRCDISQGDCFVVCDCGGGTVDLIGYKVLSTEPMTVCEIVKGTGGLCGAVFLDDGFKVLLQRKFDEIHPDAWHLVSAKELQDIMSDDWQKMRNKFTGRLSQGWTIRAPMSLYEEGILDVRDGRRTIQITSANLKEVFKPVLSKVEALVLGQNQSVLEKEGKPPKYVILVGGFGRCRFLYEWLKTRTGGVEVLQSQGSEPWTAICRGAVIHGMTVEKVDSQFGVEVQSRIARASYGIICQEKWDEDKHIKEDKIFDKQDRKWKAKNQVKWLISEGEDLMTDRKVRLNFYKLIDGAPGVLSTTIWMCKTSPPPSRKDDSVVKYAEVKWTAKINVDKLPVLVNNQDDEYPQLDYVAEMKSTAGSMEFSVLHKGRRQATKNVKVDFHDKADI